MKTKESILEPYILKSHEFRPLVPSEMALKAMQEYAEAYASSLNSEEIEILRMQLAACGVAAMCNTEKSIKDQRIDKDNPYWSASYEEVCKAVDREIKYREELKALNSVGREWTDEEIEKYVMDKYYETSSYPFCQGVIEEMKYMRDQIFTAPQKEEWIDCNERMPDLGQNVLAYGNQGVKVCKLVTYEPGSPGYADGKRNKWFRTIELDTCLQYFGVTHWQPLPPPPRPVGGKNEQG